MKLGNFLHLDPDDSRKGLSSIGRNDREVWAEFHDDKRRLRTIAQRISDIVNDKKVNHKLYRIPDDDIDNFSVKEGQTTYRLHKVKERDHRIIKAKKEQIFRKTGKLECQACGFDFYRFYGEYGKGFIECHHITPLKDIKSETKTKLSDLALLCANCHRVIHKNIDTLSVKELINIIHENR